MNPTIQPIKICFIAPKAYPLFSSSLNHLFGGAELDLYILSCELVKDPNYTVFFIVGDYGQPNCEKINGVTLLKGINLNRPQFLGAYQIWKAMKHADAHIYFQETTSAGTFLASLFCRRYQRQFVYRTAHRNDCDGTYIRAHPLLGRGYRWALKNAKCVIVQNQQDRKPVKESIGVDSIVIRNAHELPPLNRSEKDIILWVGRSAAFKRPRLFLEMARRTSDEKFIMICQHATEDNDYNSLVEEARTISNLEFIEHVPFSDIGRYFLRAKMYVNTSNSEGFANTFVDASKAGTAILSLVVNPDNFIDKHNCGFCADDDWDDFIEKFDRLRYDLDKVYQLGKNGRKYVEDNHNITEIVKEYKIIFESFYKQK